MKKEHYWTTAELVDGLQTKFPEHPEYVEHLKRRALDEIRGFLIHRAAFEQGIWPETEKDRQHLASCDWCQWKSLGKRDLEKELPSSACDYFEFRLIEPGDYLDSLAESGSFWEEDYDPKRIEQLMPEFSTPGVAERLYPVLAYFDSVGAYKGEERIMKHTTELYLEDGKTAIRTHAVTEDVFLLDFTSLLTGVVEKLELPAEEKKRRIKTWLEQAVNICCKLRGYKADVDEERVLIAGERLLTSIPAISVDEAGEVHTN